MPPRRLCFQQKHHTTQVSAWNSGNVPGDDETGSADDLRGPINPIDQRNIIHIDYPWYSGDCTDPENAGSKELYCRCNESNFVPSRTKPNPFLDIHFWLIDVADFDSVVEVVGTLRQCSSYRVTETYLQ